MQSLQEDKAEAPQTTLSGKQPGTSITYTGCCYRAWQKFASLSNAVNPCSQKNRQQNNASPDTETAAVAPAIAAISL